MNRARKSRGTVVLGCLLALTTSCAIPGTLASSVGPAPSRTPSSSGALSPSSSGTQPPDGRATSSSSPAPGSIVPEPTPVARGDEIVDAVHAVVPSATVGVLVFDRRSDTELVSVNADRQFRSASVVKLLIAIDTLRRNPAAADAVVEMLRYSNNRIASRLWVAGGYTAIISRMTRLIGLRDTEPPDIAGMWGYTKLSAQDVLRIYRYIMREMPPSRRQLIVGALANAARYAADGWDQYFGIPRGIDEPWAIKQGWSIGSGKLVLHTTGLVGPDRRYVVVLLLADQGPVTWSALREASTAGAREIEPLVSS